MRFVLRSLKSQEHCGSSLTERYEQSAPRKRPVQSGTVSRG